MNSKGAALCRAYFERIERKSMSILGDFATIRRRISAAILDVAERELADAARAELAQALGTFDFPYSRGPGGLGDPENFSAEVVQTGTETVLTLRDIAPFQGPEDDRISLAQAVDEGVQRYMHEIGPRPFYENTQAALDAGTAEAALEQGLRRCGF